MQQNVNKEIIKWAVLKRSKQSSFLAQNILTPNIYTILKLILINTFKDNYMFACNCNHIPTYTNKCRCAENSSNVQDVRFKDR